MKKILLFISFFYAFSTLAQEQLEVNVNDLLTHKPVRSVEVYIRLPAKVLVKNHNLVSRTSFK